MPILRGENFSGVLSSPLDLVQRLFDQSNQPLQESGGDWGVNEYFRKLMSDPTSRDEVGAIPMATKRQIVFASQSSCLDEGV